MNPQPACLLPLSYTLESHGWLLSLSAITDTFCSAFVGVHIFKDDHNNQAALPLKGVRKPRIETFLWLHRKAQSRKGVAGAWSAISELTAHAWSRSQILMPAPTSAAKGNSGRQDLCTPGDRRAIRSMQHLGLAGMSGVTS